MTTGKIAVRNAIMLKPHMLQVRLVLVSLVVLVVVEGLWRRRELGKES